ncbi:unnamed protein product [Xylocopa violacea]|uniref:acid phosphatase n=1 Tax=Xylocopa violacea TaxID=135666 RepID=A0ABP1PJH1_XYLVO
MSLHSQVGNAEFNVELVQVLFRHGERTPRAKELWCQDTSAYEPWGLAQLTNEGKMREYLIGKMLRKRYDQFLGDVYHPNDIYAYSSNHDRTKMSLQLVLAGLYHPTTVQMWNANLSWMPIPTHYMPEKVDVLLKPEFSPLFNQALEEARNAEEILKKVLPYRDLFKFFSEIIGTNITNTSQVSEMYNGLVAQKTMNLSLPDWYTDEIFEKLQNVMKIEYTTRSFTPYLKRLNGGLIIKKFIDNIKVNEKRDRPRKIYLYSGHEVNIAAFARAHNFTEPELPSYGCAIIFEKLRDQTGNRYIRMLFWTGITEELKIYKLPECEEVCPIEKYLDFVKEILPSDEEVNHKWDYLSKEELRQLYTEQVEQVIGSRRRVRSE